MNNLGKIRRISYLILFLFLCFIFLLFSSNHNAWLNTGANPAKTQSYLYLVAVSFLGILMFVLYLLSESKNKKNIKGLASRISDLQSQLAKKNEGEQNKEVRNVTKETVDIQEISKHILPSKENLTQEQYAEKILINIAKEFNIVQGVFYDFEKQTNLFSPIAEYAYFSEEKPKAFKLGETLTGQAAKNKKLLNINDVPQGYMTILSGLGKGTPKNLLIVPIILEKETIGVMELASFKPFDKQMENVLSQLGEKIGYALKN